MKRLPIYGEPPVAAIQSSTPLNQNTSCSGCKLSQATPAGQRCLSSEGEAGDILVVMESVTEFDRRSGRPASSSAGRWIRNALNKIAPGRNVVFTTAVGCQLKEGVEDESVAALACRGYQHQILKDADPSVVLLMGPLAAESWLGRRYHATSVREGYAWTTHNGKQIPIFMMLSPDQAVRNKVIARALEHDLSRVLDQSNPVADPEPLSAQYCVIETEDDARQAYDEIMFSEVSFVATDVETSGMMFESDFRIECLAISTGRVTYVFTRRLLEDHGACALLALLLRNLSHSSWNGQYDFCAIECEQSIRIPDDPVIHSDGLCTSPDFGKLNLQIDARLQRKIIASDCMADLATAADLVGMGGHKDAQHEAMAPVIKELRALALASVPTPTGRARKAPSCVHVKPDYPKVWNRYILEGFDEQKFAHRYVNKDVEHRYVALDACSTWYLTAKMAKDLMSQEDLGQWTIWEEVSKPAMWAWARAQMAGFPIDRSGLEHFSAYLKAEAEIALKKVHSYAEGLNPRSSKQIGELMAKLKIKSKRKTPGGDPSWSKDVLDDLRGQHPVIEHILRYNLVTSVDSKFAEGMLCHVRSDGRVHPQYLLDGTEGGRASSRDPNMFNQLKGRDAESRELGKLLRACFIAPEGWSFIDVDEGQIEIRMAANLSRDPDMIAMLNSGIDFHTQSAEKFAPVMGKDLSKMSQEEKDIFRENCKTSNFAAIYEIPSQLGFMLSKRLDIPVELGDKLGRAMFKTYRVLRGFMDKSYADALATGYARTSWRGQPARKRPLWNMGYNPESLKLLESALSMSHGKSGRFDLTEARSTYNTPVQGSAVDIITSMLWRVQRWLDANTDGGQFVLQIYDSIVLLVRDEDVQKVLDFIIPLMKDQIDNVGYMDGVPLSVDAKVGKAMSAMTKVKPAKLDLSV